MSTESFHHFITADGSSGFKAEAGRYHLYVSLACPWASRTVIVRKLKKLEDIISMSIVDPFMGEEDWKFSDGSGCIPDTVNHFDYLYQVYQKAKSDYSGVISVPVLWDKKTQTIVSNESSEIIRMLNSEFNAFGDKSVDLYPESLRDEVNKINERVYKYINLGVYKAGFADTQQEYDVAFDELFRELDAVEKILSSNRYLVGNQITEADWRLFATLVRFDPVYYVHFKCNLRRMIDYPNLSHYLRELYQYPGVAETVNFDHIKQHYYRSHTDINPKGVVPKGPEMDLILPHNRGSIC
jgi:putative glutathione S-transferase